MKTNDSYNPNMWNQIPRNMQCPAERAATTAPSFDDIAPTRKAEPVSAPKRKWWQFWR